MDPFLFVASRRYDAYDLSASPPALIAESPGAVFVYTRLGAFPAQWIPFQTIQNPSPIEGERFGHSIDYQDGTLVVSAHRAYDAGAPAMQINDCGVVGEVCIFEYSPMNNAFELQTSYRYDQTPTSYTSSVPCIPQIPPVPDNERGRGAGFGKSVAIDGDWIVVGSDASEEVAVFERDAVSGWAFHSFLENSFTSSNNINDFGTSVAIDQNRIVVGSKKQSADTVPGEIGAVTLFEYDHEIDEWVGVDHVQAPDVMTNTTNPRFGRSVYLDGDLLVVSCQGNSNGSPLPPPGYGDVAEVYTFVIDPATSEMIPQGRVYFNGEGNGYREQNQELGIAYDPVSGMIITGDINETDAENNQVRLFPACAADLDGDLAITPNDGTVFSTLYLAGDVRVDFAAPYGVLDFADVVRFNRLVGLGCP